MTLTQFDAFVLLGAVFGLVIWVPISRWRKDRRKRP